MQTIEVIMWVVCVASLIGTVANIYQMKWCFLVWFFCNVAWCAYDIHKIAYPQASLMGIYALLAIWGYLHWTKEKTKGKPKAKRFKPCRNERAESIAKLYEPVNKKFKSPKRVP
jgi:nicotinamide riboside transporter PnuC